MDFDDKRFREAVAEVDETHHEGMKTLQGELAELHYGEGRTLRAAGGTSRRGFLKRAGLAAGAITIGSQVLPFESLWSPAWAQTLDDPTIAAFAESVELAAVAAYGIAAPKIKNADVKAAATTFQGHHAEHAKAFASLSGGKAGGKANSTLVKALGPMFTAAADDTAIAKLAYSVENAAAATYLFALGALQSKEALKGTASILPVEAQHAIALGFVIGKDKTLDVTDWMPPFQTETGFIDPAKNPI